MRTTAAVLVVLMAHAALAACGPSSGGCQRASSSLGITDALVLGSTSLATLIEPTRTYANPKDDKRRFNCTKQESPFWKELKPYRGSIKTNGEKRKKARFYEWDYTHNDIEEYGPAPCASG